MAYGYDRYGRLLQDGDLGLSYDENGNALTLEYPGGVTAVYDYDLAHRPVSLTVQRPGEADQAVVTAASYLPSGPLTGLTLGNGLSETRAVDGRSAPERTTLAGAGTLPDWDYTTDPVGNVTAVTDLLNLAGSRSYAYQDAQSFSGGGEPRHTTLRYQLRVGYYDDGQRRLRRCSTPATHVISEWVDFSVAGGGTP